MEDLFKKFLYTGVGIASQATAKVRTQIETVIENNESNIKEGEKVVNSMMKKGETRKESVETSIRTYIDNTLERFEVPTRTEVNTLLARLEELEAQAK